MEKRSKSICFFPPKTQGVPEMDERDGSAIEQAARDLEEDREVQLTVYELFHANIRNIPLLTPEEEKDLSRRIQEERDPAAFQRFVLGNLRLVIACAKRVRDRIGNNSILSFMDLVQEGILGLMTAVERFDYRHNTRFSTYGIPWIYQRMKIATVQYRSGMTVPGHAGTSVHVMADHIRAYREGRLEAIPEDVDLERIKVLARISSPVISIDNSEEEVPPPYTISPERLQADIEMVEREKKDSDEIGSLEGLFFREEMLDVLRDELSEREYDALCRRFGLGSHNAPQTLGDIAAHYGKSSEYVRTLIKGILKKLGTSPGLRRFCRSWGTHNV